MNKLQFLGVFILGVLVATLVHYVLGINENGRYIPITTKYSDVNTCVLDTRTGIIYYEGIDNNRIFFRKGEDITDTTE